MVCIPDLPGNKGILPLADPRCDSSLETNTDFSFIAVTVGAVNVSVPGFQSDQDRGFDDAGGGLPGS